MKEIIRKRKRKRESDIREKGGERSGRERRNMRKGRIGWRRMRKEGEGGGE